MNDIFDKMKATGAKLAEGTAKAANNIVEKGKDQIDKLSLENDLAKAQRQLGIYVYECSKGEPSNAEVMEEFITTISDIEDKLNFYKTDELYEEVEAICPECGAQVKENATFCIRCGTKLSD